MVRSWPVRHISAASASIHAMSASEMIDKSTVIGANDDAPAGLCVMDGVNVAVISGRTAGLADVASLRPDGWRRKPVRRGSEPIPEAYAFGIKVPPRLAGCRMR